MKIFFLVILIFGVHKSWSYDIDLLNEESFGHARFKRQGAFQIPKRRYDPCVTPTGQPGHCTSVVYCRLPELNNDVWRVINQLCIIEKSSIGICCPDDFDEGTNSLSVPEILTNTESENRVGGGTRIVNRPDKRGCGTTTKQFPRVAGGRPAETDEWPWMAAVLLHNLPHIHCGGVLVTDRHVLTAAHCVHGYKKTDIFVRLGEYDFRLFNETRSRDFRVTSMVYHVDYDEQRYENDIALIRVDRPTLFNTYIWPICLPPPQVADGWEGWDAVVTGWGTLFFTGPHSKVLMEVSVPIWKQKECEKLFVERVDENMLCAGNIENGRDSCQGDSGGPLMVQLPNRRWLVVGIVSWGLRCGETHPGLYTRVDKYIPWILENTID